MKEMADVSASATTKPALTVGTIHLGARPGTRTMLGSIIDCRVRSARMINFHAKAQRHKERRKNFAASAIFAPLRETAFSFKYESHNFIDNFARSARICRTLLLDSQ